jgi:hypothetical protein
MRSKCIAQYRRKGPARIPAETPFPVIYDPSEDSTVYSNVFPLLSVSPHSTLSLVLRIQACAPTSFFRDIKF